MAIGVDSDQYNQKTVAEYKDVIISSMLKRVDVAVYDYIAAVAQNDLTTLPKVFDLKVDGVGYSTSGGKIDDETKAGSRRTSSRSSTARSRSRTRRPSS